MNPWDVAGVVKFSEKDWKIIDLIDELGLLNTWNLMNEVYEYVREHNKNSTDARIWSGRINKYRNFCLGQILNTLFLTQDTSKKYTGLVGRSLHELGMESDWKNFEKILNKAIGMKIKKDISVRNFLRMQRSSLMTHGGLQRDHRLPGPYEMSIETGEAVGSGVKALVDLSRELEQKLIEELKQKYPEIDIDSFLATLF